MLKYQIISITITKRKQSQTQILKGKNPSNPIIINSPLLQYPPDNSYLLSEQKQPSILSEQKQPSLLSSDALHIQNINPVSNNIGTVPTRIFNRPKKF